MRHVPVPQTAVPRQTAAHEPVPSPAARALDGLAFALLALLPLGMAIANKSAPPIMVGAALAALGARALAGDLSEALERIRRGLTAPIGLACLVFLAFAAISIAWSGHPRTSLHALGEVLLCGAAALGLHAALPRAIPDWAVKVAVIAISLACLSIIAELANGMALRTSLGVRDATFIFKRSVTAMMIVIWPLLLLLWLRRKISLAVSLLLLLGIATYMAHSSTTALALAAGLAVGALALRSPRGAGATAGILFLVAMGIAPVLGEVAARLIPPPIAERIAFAHAEERISIWQSFGDVVRRRPFGGAGFGTSTVMAQEPVADEVPAEHRLMLGAWHAHNGFLQVWAETGVVGALIFGVALLLLARALASARSPPAIAAAALVGSAIAVMLVGHSIWQGWWIAVLGASAIWIARLPQTRAEAATATRSRTGRP